MSSAEDDRGIDKERIADAEALIREIQRYLGLVRSLRELHSSPTQEEGGERP